MFIDVLIPIRQEFIDHLSNFAGGNSQDFGMLKTIQCRISMLVLILFHAWGNIYRTSRLLLFLSNVFLEAFYLDMNGWTFNCSQFYLLDCSKCCQGCNCRNDQKWYSLSRVQWCFSPECKSSFDFPSNCLFVYLSGGRSGRGRDSSPERGEPSPSLMSIFTSSLLCSTRASSLPLPLPNSS